LGTFRDVYRIDNSKGRIRDEKWVNDEFNFTVTNTVEFEFEIRTQFIRPNAYLSKPSIYGS
jgi:hypothetical protein